MQGFVAFSANEQRIDLLAYRGPPPTPESARERAPAIVMAKG